MIDEKTKNKIKALLNVTVQNGATPAEEQSARAIAIKLGSQRFTEVHKTAAEIKTAESDIMYYKECVTLGTINRNSDNINWDTIAKHILSHDKWWEYIQETAVAWDKHYGVPTKTRQKITLQEYRTICRDALKKIDRRLLQ